MTPLQRSELMQAVLDGEATPEEARALERLLSHDEGARAEFEALEGLFHGLRQVPMRHPPEGLVASVMARLPRRDAPTDRISQLFAKHGVIESLPIRLGANTAGRPGPMSRSRLHFEDRKMNVQGSFGKRKVLIGVGIAAAAVVLAVSLGIDFPPGTKDTVGTIVPAQRYRAPQSGDAQVGAPAAGQTSTGASSAGTADSAANNAANNSANNSAVNAATNKAVNAATDSAVNAATNKAVNAATDSAVNAATSKAVNAATDSAVNAATSKAVNAATNSAVNAATNKAVNSATNSAVNAATNSAVNAATNSAVNAATNSAVNRATNSSNAR